MSNTVILGAGLAGLSYSYHLGHENCILFEKNKYAGGHIYSHQRDGFTWDEGPHVSFTNNDYVRKLLADSIEGDYHEFECNVSNYYQGSWIPHPAQSNLFAVPQPKRSECLKDFLYSRDEAKRLLETPKNYGQWLECAFGKTFAQTFPFAYTRKYWTCDPASLATDWVGNRVYYPDVETVLAGSEKAPERKTHYISTVRYPKHGGFVSFAKKLIDGSKINLGYKVSLIDLKGKRVHFSNGERCTFKKLISTLPLPEFINLNVDVPSDVSEAALALRCSSLLLVNVTANHSSLKPYHWMYVYDKDMMSTRINMIELLSANNCPDGRTGIQVEVYESAYQPFQISHSDVAQAVVKELQDIGLAKGKMTVHTQYVPYANVIFDHNRREAQDIILSWLEQFGLAREEQDLDPMTDWDSVKDNHYGDLILAGRFGQWKYFWSDDCIMRGMTIAQGHN
ncbi:FAD-dependent oxidoreductase [Cyanobium sp. Aljojuca 7D2]|uniref:protoporphyrinogen/coproporphyrinogen oxidase n=1 Tax=Cyanobium sp. Aljojuca 7D2 TaxID=2823698 RepID=UPI0020CCE96B|nr:FAD-dependent oxidoreductase [Cyanobium sp. Aljojuca 7D2]MCP9890262.1 FAD-dependent oxidoreductase [Cyanobium sp. Aljojuca 7D2]